MPSSQFDLLLAVKNQGAQQVVSDVKSIGTAAQGAANQTNTLPTSFAKVTQTAAGMNTQLLDSILFTYNVQMRKNV